MTINLSREIRPEDFAADSKKVYYSIEARDEARQQRAELERLYHIQEAAKAKAHFKREQARKDAIPYSEAVAAEICGRISAGEFLVNICTDEDMPTVRSANQWLKEHADFKALHDEAVNDRLNIFQDEIVTIADDSTKDFKIVTKHGKATKVLDAEVVSRAKLRVEVRKAHLRAFRPERWGETSTLITKDIGNDFDSMTAEELEKQIADLEQKDRTFKAA